MYNVYEAELIGDDILLKAPYRNHKFGDFF